jgi:hypothetical protein
MVIKKILCDRCGGEIEGDAHPPRLLVQSYHISEKVCVQSAYRGNKKIHFCDVCQKHFEEFMKNER